VVLLAEPPVLRRRRSGNLVLGAANRELPIADLVRRAAGGIVRFRVVGGADLTDFVDGAAPAWTDADLPLSGESTGIRLR
jgi:hypothetical protein